MTAVHYLKPDGERVMDLVWNVHYFDRYVQWADGEREVWVRVPWERVLLIESNASKASPLVAALDPAEALAAT